MERIPEPELMDDEVQALAYARADFAEPHQAFVTHFARHFPEWPGAGSVVDLGCGPADVVLRFARAYPACRIDGVDGSAAMLKLGREAVMHAGLAGRVRLHQGLLPGARLPLTAYEVVISNSLLHHLHEPAVLWQAVSALAAPGARVFVMDLMRPASAAEVRRLVEEHAAGAPEVLLRDFTASLHAAFTPDEVRAQLRAAGLDGLAVETLSDRHLGIWGTMT